MNPNKPQRKLLTVIMDGIGHRSERFGNAVALARTPWMNYLHDNGLFRTLKAHGTFVGLPSDSDMGNSEVGHNAIGAGRTFDQGAKLVKKEIADGTIFKTPLWHDLIKRARSHTLHFIGLLSDGNVHSHEDHLYALLRQAHAEGVVRLRVHVLFDGRDVPAKSAEKYVGRLEAILAELRALGCDALAASGGGRMRITMDRYQADWAMVERGWRTHVLGEGRQFPTLEAALGQIRSETTDGDQYLPEFVIARDGKPVGPILDGDCVVFFNFRGDRAIEISRAFEEQDFSPFDRRRVPDVLFAGMMQYDGDLLVPKHYLVAPPPISDTLGEYMASCKLRQFACSETQKFGHVTYFWNGNRSGYFDRKLETYVEVPSDREVFDRAPWMKAKEITDVTVQHMLQGTFDFGRINYANGDMVGHTGDLDASVTAVAVVDLMLGRLIHACQKTDTILAVTADHGNCDEMFWGEESDFKDWESVSPDRRPPPKTSHSLAEVPLYIFDPRGAKGLQAAENSCAGLANLANTYLALLGLKPRAHYEPSLITRI